MSDTKAEVKKKFLKVIDQVRKAEAIAERNKDNQMFEAAWATVEPDLIDPHRQSYENIGKTNTVWVLFMDIVGYSKLRVDKYQAQVVETLISYVKQALKDCEIRLDWVVCLPTGDGMCLCFINDAEAPAQVGARIQTLLAKKPFQTEDGALQVRMGIHHGTVWKIKDLKGGYNLAGSAINVGQRAMNCGDGGHILYTKDAYETLNRITDDFKDAFQIIPSPFVVKHNESLTLYNYFRQNEFGNVDEPIRPDAKCPACGATETPIS